MKIIPGITLIYMYRIITPPVPGRKKKLVVRGPVSTYLDLFNDIFRDAVWRLDTRMRR